jgi:hypothetical protein
MTTNETPRAARIADLAADLDIDPLTAVTQVADRLAFTMTPLHAMIAAEITTDDDADDLFHEIEHALLMCDDTDCM